MFNDDRIKTIKTTSHTHHTHRTAFLTNTSVNKKAGVAVDDLTWPFPQVYAYLKQIGVSPDLLWSRIERAVVQVLLSAEPAFLRSFKQLNADFTCQNCYQLLGVASVH